MIRMILLVAREIPWFLNPQKDPKKAVQVSDQTDTLETSCNWWTTMTTKKKGFLVRDWWVKWVNKLG